MKRYIFLTYSFITAGLFGVTGAPAYSFAQEIEDDMPIEAIVDYEGEPDLSIDADMLAVTGKNVSAEVASSLGNAEDIYQKGRAAFLGINGEMKDYQKAFPFFVEAAKAGNAKAYVMLGVYSDFGIVVRKKPEIAFARYKTAADLGNPTAMFNIATMYLSGQGIEPDANEAVKWFTKSAENGNSEAAYNLGVMYLKGIGINASKNTAKQWFEKAYELGNPTAKMAINMGGKVKMYERVQGAL